jgi:hypothetical protein
MTDLAEPPQFGPDGSAPPPYSAEVLYAQDFFLLEASGQGPVRALEALSSSEYPELDEARRWLADVPSGAANRFVTSVQSNRQWDSQRVGKTAAVGTSATVAGALVGTFIIVPVAPLVLGVGAGAAGVYYWLRRHNSTKNIQSEATRGSAMLRRAVCTKRWKRNEDEIVWVAPGAIQTLATQVTVGLSSSSSSELGASIGAGGKAGVTNLTAQLSAKIGKTITLINQEQVTLSTSVSNPHEDCMRKFAIWYPEYVVSVFTLDLVEGRPAWRTETTANLVQRPSLATTYIDVPIRR